MTTILIRYTRISINHNAVDYQDFLKYLMDDLRKSSDVKNVIPVDLHDDVEFDICGNLLISPSEYIYVPLICRNIISSHKFQSEIGEIFNLKHQNPKLRIMRPIGIEHVDTSILSTYPSNLETLINVIKLYSKMPIFSNNNKISRESIKIFAEDVSGLIHNDVMLLKDIRNKFDFGDSETHSSITQGHDASPKYQPGTSFTDTKASWPQSYEGNMNFNSNSSFPVDQNYNPNYPESVYKKENDVYSKESKDDGEGNFIYFNLRKKIIVAKDGSGDFRSLADAVRKSEEGSIIIVKPGIYEAPQVINKSITIVGENDLTNRDSEKAEIHIKGTSPIRCISFKSDVKRITSFIKLKNLIIKHSGNYFNDEIKGACLFVEDCEFTIQESIVIGGSYGLYAGRDSFIRTLGGVFTNATKANILVESTKKVEIQRSQISSSSGDGIYIKWNAQPIISNCRIFQNKSNGINIQGESGSRIRDSKINNNGKCGVVAYIGAYCDIVGSDICNNQEYGVNLHFRHKGSATDNKIIGNSLGPKMVEGNKISGDFRTNEFVWIRNREK